MFSYVWCHTFKVCSMSIIGCSQCIFGWSQTHLKKLRYKPCDADFNKLSRGSASSLLAFHALPGCDNTSYIANHTKSSSWHNYKEHHDLLNNLGIVELTDETNTSSETCVCKIYNMHRTDSIDALMVPQDGWTISYCPNKWYAPFSLDECTLSNDYMEKRPLPHTWAPCTLRYGTKTWRIRYAACNDGIESHTRLLPRDSRMFESQAIQDSSLQMGEIRIAMNINNKSVCMLAPDWSSARRLAWIATQYNVTSKCTTGIDRLSPSPTHP